MPDSRMPLLQVCNLKKAYRTPEGGTVCVVDIPRFDLESRQQVALSGESGSGKTTFLNLIAGIVTPDEGTICVAGAELTAMTQSSRDRLRAEQCGYIFQTFNLLEGFTALQNVLLGMTFGRKQDRAFGEDLLRRMGLSNRLHYYPRQLSTGQQQRVAVARALANRPRLVLADEPTGNLDRRNAMEALNLIRTVCRENDASLLLVSHDASVLEGFEVRRDLAELNFAAKEKAA